ncbi:type II secretion system protein GspD, partial [Stenotrophomonas pictorum]|uniref:type II secretion system protein GspD n=1 Tax=Stenotrophomonas pictorum TaxID=86184 RepID=UPI00210A191D
MAIDPIRNVIVFQGEAQRWRAIQGVLARLDQPARQVVIEVTVAEVTMTDEFSHGIEWALRNVSVNGMSGPVTALQGLAGTGGGGLVWQGVSSSGQVKALLNLFAKDSRVSILSTPRILVKSGESASIDVGTEVPIITSQATASDLPSTGGNSSILQSVQYRKTGVLLDIEAVVHSGQRVDLKISQEVSEATPTDTSEISSPSVFSRKLNTSLSLADGESTLLGGLISSTRSDGKTKVPLLGDIPILGKAFQSAKRSGTRTELLMLITPYVVEDAAQTRAITDAIRARFGAAERRR